MINNQTLINNYLSNSKKNEEELLKLKSSICIEKSFNEENFSNIINYVLLTKLTKEEELFISLKRANIFKLSERSDNRFIVKIINFLLENKNIFNFSELEIKYFESKINLSLFSNEIYEDYLFLVNLIENYGSSLVNDLIFLVDNKFFKRLSFLEFSFIKDEARAEDISECVSYLLELISKLNVKVSNKYSYESSKLQSEELMNILSFSKELLVFNNLQKLIDDFNYICIKNDNNLIVKSKNELLEKSRKYGYVHSDIQRINLQSSLVQHFGTKIPSLYQIIETQMIKISSLSFITFKKRNDFVELSIRLNDELKSILLTENLYLEELIEFEEVRKEYFLGWDDDEILKFEFIDDVTMLDIFKIRRLFFIIGNLNSYYLHSQIYNKNIDAKFLYQSLIKTDNTFNINKILFELYDESKINKFMNNITWDINSNDYLDLQYTPFLQLGNTKYLTMNIFNQSNILRKNLFKNINRVNRKEFLSEELYTAIKLNFYNVKKSFNYTYNGKKNCEADVITLIGNTLYVFECKDTINSASLRELKNIKDYIDAKSKKKKKNKVKNSAFEQLKRFKLAVEEENLLDTINNNLGWKTNSDTEVVYCAVLNSRMFNGFSEKNFHVQSIYELISFFKSGEIKVENKKISLWKEKNISGDDVYDFIQNRNLRNIIFDTAELIYEDEMKFQNYNLKLESYKFDVKRINQNIILHKG